MSFIGINFDQLTQNITKLLEQAATIPDRAAVRQVEGAGEEPAQANYRKQLTSTVASQLANEIDSVRKFVEANAAAFQKAAASMQETEGADSLAARQADALVQDVVAAPSASPAPGTPPAPGNTGPKKW
ncbi:hypothetical protein LQ938_14030 [Microbacterium sp. cx-55]|uniref:hypothetical protein n=1 Tax=Microbacterium sp. cx-55 TaxID=2875948 RepID=UPI001CC0EA19|nr:hypothetical protein [Microbacterium sp. cx-55]MBZ4488310.1 hypothetical protein [Microbacterium sp. cx-55]UGB34969.1 hypothetical protein LQ938_14030 [Microbacterium sp. cx-55]